MRTVQTSGSFVAYWSAAAAAALAAGCLARPDRVDETLERYRAQAAETGRRPSAAEPTAPPPGTVVEGGEVRMSLQGAFRAALAGNHEVLLAGYDPLAAEEEVMRALAVFDPSVFASGTFGRTKRPIQSTLDTGRVTDAFLIEDTWSVEAGVTQPFPWGGSATLFQQLDHLESNSALTLPNPQARGSVGVELSQPLLKGFGDRVNRASIRVATLNLDVSREGFRQTVMDVIAEVTQVYWELAFERAAADVIRESLGQGREVLRREKVRRERGISKDLDVDRAMTAVTIREAERVRAERRIDAAVDRLKVLLNSRDASVESPLTIVPSAELTTRPVVVDRAEAVGRALANRPDLTSARLAVAAGRVQVDAADHERLPRLDAVLRYALNGLGGNTGEALETQRFTGPFSWSAGVEFEWPLGNREADADYRRRQFALEQSLIEADRLALEAIRQVSDALRAVEAARREVEIGEKARDAAARTMRGETVRFELGQTSNEELLFAQDRLLRAHRDLLQARLEFNLALIDLALAQGTILEEAGIEIIEPERKPATEQGPYRVRLAEGAAERLPELE